MNHFELVGRIGQVETIVVGNSIKERDRLVSLYGPGRWRKMKGFARVVFADGIIEYAEIHWYEAHGIGRKEVKIKRILR